MPWAGNSTGIEARTADTCCPCDQEPLVLHALWTCRIVQRAIMAAWYVSHNPCTLNYDLDIDTDTLPVVLSLVDQLYDTRQRLLSLTAAVAVQDKNVQAAIIGAMNSGYRKADIS